MVKVSEYIDERGKSPYAEWHDHLDARAAAKAYWQDYKARKRKSK